MTKTAGAAPKCYTSPAVENSAPVPNDPKYGLKLYVSGSNPRSELALRNLERICREELDGNYSLEVIDILQEPQRAEDERVLATPLLIKNLPPPLRRIIGDLSDTEKVLVGLHIDRHDGVPKAE